MSEENSQATTSRFYEDEHPEVGDVVYIKVARITDHGVFVSLMEYGCIEGYITSGELSRKRLKNIKQIVKVGNFESALVQRVNEKTGEVDLSLKGVQPEDKLKCETRYKKAKHVHSIMRQLAELTEIEITSLYDTIAWPLHNSYGDTALGFKQFLEGETDLEDIAFPSAEAKAILLEILKKKLKAEEYNIRAKIELTCYTIEGIDAIKKALYAGMHQGEGDQIKVNLIATPEFSISLVSHDRDHGIAMVEQALEKMRESINASGGNLKVVSAAAVVNEKEN
jgi:translation initiation factor 2 subunit 1